MKTNRPFKQDQPKLKVDLGDNTVQNIVIILMIAATIFGAITFS